MQQRIKMFLFIDMKMHKILQTILVSLKSKKNTLLKWLKVQPFLTLRMLICKVNHFFLLKAQNSLFDLRNATLRILDLQV